MCQGMMNLSNNKQGFTLVELLIAVLILAMAIGGVLLMYVTSMMSSQLAWDSTVAMSHAEYVLEEAQTQDSIDEILKFNWKDWAEGQGLNTLPGEKINVVFSDVKNNILDMRVAVHWVRKDRKNDITLRTKLAK